MYGPTGGQFLFMAGVLMVIGYGTISALVWIVQFLIHHLHWI